MPLTIIAQITAVKGKEGLVRAALRNLVATTRAEAGCLRYDLHEDNDTPGVFVFYEIWESRELWQNHIEAPHIAAYREATMGAVADFALSEMTLIA